LKYEPSHYWDHALIKLNAGKHRSQNNFLQDKQG
jgi:hypothetical protein